MCSGHWEIHFTLLWFIAWLLLFLSRTVCSGKPGPVPPRGPGLYTFLMVPVSLQFSVPGSPALWHSYWLPWSELTKSVQMQELDKSCEFNSRRVHFLGLLSHIWTLNNFFKSQNIKDDACVSGWQKKNESSFWNMVKYGHSFILIVLLGATMCQALFWVLGTPDTRWSSHIIEGGRYGTHEVGEGERGSFLIGGSRKSLSEGQMTFEQWPE